jgi:hypothetical protein
MHSLAIEEQLLDLPDAHLGSMVGDLLAVEYLKHGHGLTQHLVLLLKFVVPRTLHIQLDLLLLHLLLFIVQFSLDFLEFLD